MRRARQPFGKWADHAGEIELCEYDDPFELLRDLLPGPDWELPAQVPASHSPARVRWVFRGQADTGWDLTPTAHRRGLLDEFLRAARLHFRDDPPGQREKELAAVLAFVDQCRRCSTPVPEDGQSLRDLEERARSKAAHEGISRRTMGGAFPPRELRSLFAIAQHHGVPTRLLDWTASPFVAGYLAAREGAERVASEPSRPRIAVWCLLRSEVEACSDVLAPGLRFIEAPHDANAFLRAQRGLFTVVQNVREGGAGDDREEELHGVEDVLAYAWNYAKSMAVAYPRPWLRKLTLPCEEAPRLLEALDRIDVNAGTIFPGHRGAFQAVTERRWWPSSTPPLM